MDRPDDWPWPDYDPAATADERTTLLHFLDEHRRSFEQVCDGLTPEQLARRSVEPSDMSLLGLLRHLAGVEHGWFRTVLQGDDSPRPFTSADDSDADFRAARADPDQVAEAWAEWRRQIEAANRFVRNAPDLEITGTERWRGPISLRWVLIHMIEEYAQHNGHADLLRERIDGHVRGDPMDDA